MSEPDAEARTTPRRPLILLVAGAVSGIALALVGLLQPSAVTGRLPAGAAAAVNGAVIGADDYARALAALANDRRTPPTAAERARVLERMIDEELLVQHALALGLARLDRIVRAGLVDAVIAAATAEAHDRAPSLEALARFYERERASFTRPGHVEVAQIFVRVAGADDATARRRIVAARARVLAGAPLPAVAAALGDAPPAPVPEGVLTLATLQEYVGPTAVRAVRDLEVGGLTPPVRSGAGYHVLWLRARTEPWVPPLAEIEDAVRVEYRRRAGERALADYLAALRADAVIRRAPPSP